MPQSNTESEKPEFAEKVVLDVDHVWQLDPEHEIAEDERKRICAIACMKMVIDFVVPEQGKQLSLHTMYEEMKASGARNSKLYWRHPDQVDYFKSLGLTSWRRNWHAPSNDPKWFAENEHYNTDQLVAVSSQMSNEQRFSKGQLRGQFLYSLRSSFAKDMPVIASVRADMSGRPSEETNHQVVLCGYEKYQAGGRIFFVDPILAPEDHKDQQSISVEDFFKASNYLAIFVEKPAS